MNFNSGLFLTATHKSFVVLLDALLSCVYAKWKRFAFSRLQCFPKRAFKPGMEILFTFTGCMNCRMSLSGRKIYFILKFCLYPSKEKKERKLKEWEILILV